MLNINTNYAASFASKAASSAQRGLDSAMEKLSSGSRINYAKDDAAGQAISTRMTAEIQGLAMIKILGFHLKYSKIPNMINTHFMLIKIYLKRKKNSLKILKLQIFQTRCSKI